MIASSSILPDDVDEAVVAAIEPLPSGNTRLVLDRALRYTHLGVVLAVEGEERVVDMRAEVAVLTRNVVVQASAPAAGNAAVAGKGRQSFKSGRAGRGKCCVVLCCAVLTSNVCVCLLVCRVTGAATARSSAHTSSCTPPSTCSVPGCRCRMSKSGELGRLAG